MPSQSRSRVLQQQQQALCSKPDLAWTVQSPETMSDVLQLDQPLQPPPLLLLLVVPIFFAKRFKAYFS